MALITLDITIEQGATFTLDFVWKDSDGIPVDLTGYSGRMQVRKAVGSADAALTLTSPTGITLGGNTGAISVKATPTQTSAITLRTGVYDLELQDPNGDVLRFAEGAATVSFEVTRV